MLACHARNRSSRHQRSLHNPPLLLSRSPLPLHHRLNYSALNALVHHNSFCSMLTHSLDGENRTLTSHLISPVGRIYSVKPMRWISLSGSVAEPLRTIHASLKRGSVYPRGLSASRRGFHQRGLDDAMKFGARKQGMALRKNWFSMRKGQAMSRLCVASRGCPGNSESIRCIRLIHYFDVANPRSLAPCATGFPTMLVRSSPTR